MAQNAVYFSSPTYATKPKDLHFQACRKVWTWMLTHRGQLMIVLILILITEFFDLPPSPKVQIFRFGRALRSVEHVSTPPYLPVKKRHISTCVRRARVPTVGGGMSKQVFFSE